MKRRPSTALIIAGLVLVFMVLLTPRVLKVWRLAQRSEGLNAQLLGLQQENRRLETELRLLRDDPVYLEKVARRKFHKAKEGEIVYKIVRDQAPKGEK